MSDKKENIDFITTCCSVTSIQELHKLFAHKMESLGFDKYGYQLIRSPNYNSQESLILSTYPEEWVDYYLNNDYTKIDPVIIKGLDKISPFQWSSLWQGIDMSKKQKIFFNEADDYGVAQGIGIPVFSHGGGKAMISLVSEESSTNVQKIFNEKYHLLQVLSLYYHHAVLNLCGTTFLNSTFSQDFQLTPRELDLIKWIAEGKTFPEISLILGISENTVQFHAKNLYRKMNVTSKQELVIKAFVSGIIRK